MSSARAQGYELPGLLFFVCLFVRQLPSPPFPTLFNLGVLVVLQ